MSEGKLPTPRELRLRILGLDTLVCVPAFALMVFYMSMLLEITAREWWFFSITGLGYAILAAIGMEPIRARLLAPIRAYLRSRSGGEGEVSTPQSLEEVRRAFGAVISFPRSAMLLMLLLWVIAAPFVPTANWLLGFHEWASSERVVVLLVAAITGGLVSSALSYFAIKRALDPIRESVASQIPDPEERRALIRPTPLSRKLQYVVAGSGGASLVFTMGLAYAMAGNAIDAMATGWQSQVLESTVSRMPDGDFEAVLASMLPAPELMPYPLELELLDPQHPVREDRVAKRVLAWVAEGRSEGEYAATGADSSLAWRALPDGRVLLSRIPRSALRAPVQKMKLALGTVLAMAVTLSLVVAWLMASDVSRSVKALGAEAERMALGDLRRGRVLESEDELGDLARSFERMGAALRATVGRVAEAADRVDSTAGEIATVSESVAAASADQVRQIQQASELMLEINRQVAGVAESAQALNVSVEESSSSILELGAAGDELNDTASVLSSKVDEVSTSIEQMVRSVQQVGASSEALSDAASETSSSMEEMASAMRAVDSTAEKASELSRDVVSSSEKGQGKVRQTIDGMQAIREATDSAEQVIRGLGARTEEIGAILDVIDDVADETNLLALNAAIIAAQAGEHGRAFSVVADEIKELADRVLASTKEISGLITAVQAESANATGAIEEGSRSVAGGVELSAEAGISLEEITRSSRESGDRIREIVSAVREQTKAASHVVELMERVRGGVEQIRAAGGEQSRGNEVVHRSATTMRDVAQQVRRTTEEQARGFGRIRESVEGVREAVEQINGSLQEQSTACSRVAQFLEEVHERTQSNEQAGQRMGEAMRGLMQQAEALREDVAKFQI
jgi:methyl-accepting chemotaxis protein